MVDFTVYISIMPLKKIFIEVRQGAGTTCSL